MESRMSNRINLTIKLFTGCAGSLILAWSTFATTNNYSIGINFGPDQRAEDATRVNPIVVGNTNSGLSGALAAGDLAGVPGVKQRNWNNAQDLSNGIAATDVNQSRLGTNLNLVADSTNIAVATSASVRWSANGTWATSGYRERDDDPDHDLEHSSRINGGRLSHLCLYDGRRRKPESPARRLDAHRGRRLGVPSDGVQGD